MGQDATTDDTLAQDKGDYLNAPGNEVQVETIGSDAQEEGANCNAGKVSENVKNNRK